MAPEHSASPSRWYWSLNSRSLMYAVRQSVYSPSPACGRLHVHCTACRSDLDTLGGTA